MLRNSVESTPSRRSGKEKIGNLRKPNTKVLKEKSDTARAVITDEKARTDILSFEHLKALSMDGMCLALLKEGAFRTTSEKYFWSMFFTGLRSYAPPVQSWERQISLT